MGKIIQIREISCAVKDFDQAYEKYTKMGFKTTGVWVEETPPIQAKLTSMPVGGSSLSFMQSTDEDSPITRFIKKRGEGIFSFTLWVDSVEEVMEEWKQAGVEFVLEKPMEVPDGFSVGQPIPVIVGNWTRPSSLHGVVIELQEFRTKDGKPYTPPPLEYQN